MTENCHCTISQPYCLYGQRLFINISIYYKSGIVINSVKPESTTAQHWVAASKLYSDHVKENKK